MPGIEDMVLGVKESEINEFGQKLNYAMFIKNISDCDFAKRLDLSEKGLTILKQTKNPTPRTIHKVSKALNVPVTYFFEKESLHKELF